MTLGAFIGVLAQHGGHDSGSSTGQLIMTIFLVAVLALIWIALGVVCWIFWRAKKREDEAKARADLKETEWRSAPSS